MTQYSISAFDDALAALGEYKSALSGIPDCIKVKASEIRLRCGYAPALSLASGEIYITDAPRVSREGLEDIFLHLCGHSVYSHQEEIARGYITISGGHRAGLAGQAVVEGGEIIALSEISSINLRIARQFIGCADEIVNALFRDRLCGALIVGPPCSGKTTALRDIALALSSGRMSRPRKVTVVDERGEIAA